MCGMWMDERLYLVLRCLGGNFLLFIFPFIRFYHRAVHRLRHPAIVSVEAYFFESTLLFVQTPLIEGPSLRDWLHTLNRTDLHTRIYDIGIVYQRLLQALIYMHQHGVVNLGLCLDNVVLDAHMQPVIVNFDYAVESGMYDRIRVSQRGLANRILLLFFSIVEVEIGISSR